jgi:hypothetical protein
MGALDFMNIDHIEDSTNTSATPVVTGRKCDNVETFPLRLY